MSAIRKTLRHSRSLFRCALAAGLIFFTSAASPQATWTPSQPVELVVGYSPGGGTDRSARKINRIFQDQKLVPNSVVVNKPGGSGAVGWLYLNNHKGNGNYLGIATPTLITNHIAGRGQYRHTDFTPIARLFTESAVFAVATDSPIKDWRDLVARLKKDPASVSLGSGNLDGAAPLTFGAAVKANGVESRKMKLVVFSSAGDAVTASMGGHIDVAVVTSEGVKQQLAAGKMRALAISSAKRLASGTFALVPTLTEHGLKVVSGSWRVVLGPRGMTHEQIAYWNGVFAKLTATGEWAHELEAGDATNEYLNSADTSRFLDSQYAQLKEIMSDLGLAKQ